MLQDGNAVVTLFVPVNSAFETIINAPSFLAAPETMADFVRTRPELVPILTSYSTASHLWPLASLFAGAQVPTMASADKTNKIPIRVEAGEVLRGVGSSAKVLQGNLLACGPAVVHVIDQVLLPFGLEKQAIDAISDSQVKRSPVSVSPPAV
ncbi:hypothetical protein H632_c2791p0 [Helicosporidium sp. ATCC 50920]|nr:hypothetical protein H632_c2791p0 [Helicosporidium sp. ATCC 50920]|eukprot:KDD72872.1 hypothetical protein H632_c2791p0 [Helicosporidium sp. ATCC 50920]